MSMSRETSTQFQRVDAGLFQASMQAIGEALAEMVPPREDGSHPRISISRDERHLRRIQAGEGEIKLPVISISVENMQRFLSGYNRMALQRRLVGELSDDRASRAQFKLTPVQADLRINFTSDIYEELLVFGSNWLANPPRLRVVLECMGARFDIAAELSSQVSIPPPTEGAPEATTLTAGVIMTSYVGWVYMVPVVNQIRIGMAGAGLDPSGRAWTVNWASVEKTFSEENGE